MSVPDTAANSDPRVAMAAANNAAWCAAMCRAHGLSTHRDDTRWWSGSRTPPFYPDAVTLDPTIGAADVLDGLDSSAGCSVKDSFHTLDLTSAGFRPLLQAEWIFALAAADSGPPPGLRGVVVRDGTRLQQWQRTWGEDASEIFVPGLLEDPDVRLVSVSDGVEVVAVAALNRAAGAVGISNVVSGQRPGPVVWRSIIAIAAAEFPGLDLVGYEQGEDLESASAAGFQQIGRLQVWAH